MAEKEEEEEKAEGMAAATPGGGGGGDDEIKTSSHMLRSAHSSGMESSILRFKDVNFIVGKKDAQKNILTDVSGKVRWGREYLQKKGKSDGSEAD
jgi:hypothetical protein